MGLLDSIFGGGGGALKNKGYKYLDDAAHTAGTGYRNLVNYVNNQRALGGYNPDAAVQLANRDMANTFKLGTGNISANNARLGYKPGDSSIEQQQRHFGEDSQIALQKQLLGIRGDYQNRERQDMYGLNSAAGNYSGMLAGLGDKYVGYGQQEAASNGGIGSLLGSLGSMGVFGSGVPGLGNPPVNSERQR